MAMATATATATAAAMATTTAAPEDIYAAQSFSEPLARSISWQIQRPLPPAKPSPPKRKDAMGSLAIALPYWHVNVPERLRTKECPPFLRGLCLKDIRTVSTPDSEYRIQSWGEVARLIDSNRLEHFQRVPSQLRRYKAFSHRLAAVHGSVANFVLKERLRWSVPVVARGGPFQHDDDWKILFNDWPYGLDARIVHLVVWTKFELKATTSGGDLTDKARKEIDDFVSQKFRSRMPGNRVKWFKNWAALKSIHAVEHFHVMLFDPDPSFIKEITNGDIPQCDRVGPL